MEKNLENNIKAIQKHFENSEQLIVKKITSNNQSYAVLYIVGLNDSELLSKFVITPLKDNKDKISDINMVCEKILTLGETIVTSGIDDFSEKLLKGKALLLVDGFSEGIILGVDKFKERAISEPPTSAVLKGPRAGFVESMLTNLATLRKIVATPKLKTKSTVIGKYTETSVTIVYIEGVADNEIVKKIEKKLEKIDIDGVIDSNYIASFLEEKPSSIFKQVGSSEKPDVIASKILEGRIAIIVDGSPMVLTLPYVYFEDLQSGDDYYNNSARATFVRWIRIVSIFVSILTPALYIAIVLHHYKAIPLKFLITIINTTKGLPLTPFAEILFVLVLFEILYEASLRMPKYLGLALSIVGALILGDTAVKAGLISPPAVMIVAVSGLTIYCIPDQAPQLYIFRMLFTLAGGMLGFFGITALMIFLISYLVDFDNYSTPYFSPVAPLIHKDLKDSLYKGDIKDMKTRPISIKNNRKNNKRQGK